MKDYNINEITIQDNNITHDKLIDYFEKNLHNKYIQNLGYYLDDVRKLDLKYRKKLEKGKNYWRNENFPQHARNAFYKELKQLVKKHIMNNINEANKLNIDDLIQRGYSLGPDEIDPSTGGITNKVYNLDDFNKNIKNIYDVYKDMTKFKGASNENIKNLAKKITKDLATSVKDIKELKAYISLIKQNLAENEY